MWKNAINWRSTVAIFEDSEINISSCEGTEWLEEGKDIIQTTHPEQHYWPLLVNLKKISDWPDNTNVRFIILAGQPGIDL